MRRFFFTETLSIDLILNILIKNLFNLKNSRIYYYKSNTILKKRISFITRIFGIKFIFIDQGLARGETNQPSTFFAINQKAIKLSKEVVSKFNENNIFTFWISPQIQYEKSKKTLQQLIAKDLLMYYTLDDYSYLNNNDNQSYICISHYNSINFIDKKYLSGHSNIQKILFIKETIFFRIFKLLYNLSTSINFRSLNKVNYKSKRKKIAIYGIKSHSHPLSDHWWVKNLNFNKSDIVFFYKNSKNPATEKIIKMTLENNYDFRILNNKSNNTKSFKTKKIYLSPLRIFQIIFEIIKIPYRFRKTKLFLWNYYYWLSYVYEVNYWNKFIKQENIILVKNDEYEISTDILGLASDMAGIKKIGFHWSDRYFLEYCFMPISDVYFVWGKLLKEIFEKEYRYDFIKVHVSGSPFHSFPLITRLYDDSNKIVNEIKSNRNIDHVITVFDRSNSPKAMYGINYHIEFYDKLLKFIESNEKFHLIIKPKNEIKKEVFNSNNIKERVESLIKNKKVTLLSPHKNFFTICKFTDLTISLGLNTAGVMASLSEVKSLFWDPLNFSSSHHLSYSELSGFNNQNIVYGKLNNLIENINFHIEGSVDINSQINKSRVSHSGENAYEKIAKIVNELL
jgi:hypothetical protein